MAQVTIPTWQELLLVAEDGILDTLSCGDWAKDDPLRKALNAVQSLRAALQAAPAQPVNQVLVEALKHIANDNWPDADLSAEEYAALVLAQAQQT